MRPLPSGGSRAARLAGRLAALGVGLGAGAVVGTVAALRHDRPMHAVGRTFHATLEHTGAGEPSGVPWLDRPRTRTGLVRFSRGAGLPGWAPDVQGVAIRVEDGDGRTDLLLSSSGLRGPARFALVPRRSPVRGPSGSLMPFRGPDGPLLLAVEPDGPEAGRPGAAAAEAEPDLSGTRWRLLWSGVTGPWRPFAVLEIGADAGPMVDRSTRFDPVTATPPGLPAYRWARLLRNPAYRLAQALGRPGTT